MSRFDNPSDADWCADKLVKLHNLDQNDGNGKGLMGKSAHDELFCEISDYFQNKVRAIQNNPAVRDLRSEVLCLGKNISTSLSDTTNQWADNKPAKWGATGVIKYEIDPVYDTVVQTPKGPEHQLFVGDANGPHQSVPIAFQITDMNTGLTFSVMTAGGQNADYLMQKLQAAKRNAPSPYKSWSQYWGGKAQSQAQTGYQTDTGQRKSKYEPF